VNVFAAREGHSEAGTRRMLCDWTGKLCIAIAAVKHLLVYGLCECREKPFQAVCLQTSKNSGFG